MPFPRIPRFVLSAVLAPLLAVSLLGSAAAALPRYERVIDITFPTHPGARYSDDYAGGRSGGRVHRATDLLGQHGWPVVAARAGRIAWMPSSEHPSAGFGMQVAGRDGRTYAYYHLGRAGGRKSQAVARGLREGSRVRRGQLLGYLGDSGNAAGTPHLHFEISDPRVTDPYGGERRNPYRSLRAAERRGDYPSGVSARASRGDRRRPPVTAPDAVLRKGDRGPAVAAWQRALNRVRHPDIAVDGVFGRGTLAATRRFQRNARLDVDGIVGPATRAALRQAVERKARRAERARQARRRDARAPVLRRGDRGPAVATWQRRLNRVRRPDIGVDGIFGRGTHVATRRFQRRSGLDADGIVGPATRAALRRALR